MPNIEIHGLKTDPTFSEYSIIRAKIIQAIGKTSCATEAVITDFNDVVADLKGIRQPFIRICSSEAKHAGEIIECLNREGVNIDIEVQPLARFIPKKE